MNPKVKKLWLKALRSGKYEQGYGYLRNEGLYCCLGVLTDIAIKEGVIPLDKVYWYEGYLEDEITKWSDLSKKDQEKLAEANDGVVDTDFPDPDLAAATFEEIALMIENGL